MKNRILISIVFLFTLLGGMGLWYWQKNTYSKDVLKMEIIAPSTVNIGEEIEYIVKLKNNGEVRLEDPQLIFEFPAHSLPADKDYALRRNIEGEQIGVGIYPGEEKIFKFRARLFGQEGDVKEAKATISYHPKNLTAKYVSKTSFITVLNFVPLTFEFDTPSFPEAGKSFRFSLNYFSSVDFPLSDARIKIEYPSGFIFERSESKSLNNNEWAIPVLNKGEGRRIVVLGVLGGEVDQEKIFQAEFGIWVGGDYVPLKKTIKKIKIIEPLLYIDQMINGTKDYAASPGDLLHYQIIFRNIGDQPFQNLFLVVKLKGDVLDFSTLKSEEGEHGPGDNSIIWDSRKLSSLKFLDVGEEGEIDFWINVKKDVPMDVKNPTIESEIKIGQAKKQFTTRLASKIELVQSLVHDDEIFGSTGPLPLKVGQASNLTAIWRLKNYSNPLKNVKVRVVLADQARPTGQVNPQKLTFDQQTKELIWEVGDLPSGAGTKELLQIAFQLNITPAFQQIGGPIVLFDQIRITGFDEWVNKDINIVLPSLGTDVLGANGIVVQ